MFGASKKSRLFGLKGTEAMQISKEVIESLAQAWAAEAKRLRSRTSCDCGCGAEVTAATRFKPGHDARLLKTYKSESAT